MTGFVSTLAQLSGLATEGWNEVIIRPSNYQSLQLQYTGLDQNCGYQGVSIGARDNG